MKTNIFMVVSMAFMYSFVYGCVGSPYGFRVITFKPKESNLIGTWVSDRGDVLELREDHSAVGHGLHLFNDSDEPQKRIPSPDGAKGQWYLKKHQDAWWVLRVAWEYEGEFRGIDCMYMILDYPPHTILRDLSDPDSGDVILLTCKRQNRYHGMRKLLIYGPVVVVIFMTIRYYRWRKKCKAKLEVFI